MNENAVYLIYDEKYNRIEPLTFLEFQIAVQQQPKGKPKKPPYPFAINGKVSEHPDWPPIHVLAFFQSLAPNLDNMRKLIEDYMLTRYNLVQDDTTDCS